MEQHKEHKHELTQSKEDNKHVVIDTVKKNEIVKQNYLIPIAIVVGAIIISLSGKYGSNSMKNTSNTQNRTIQTQQTNTAQTIPAQQRQQIAPQGGGGCGV